MRINSTYYALATEEVESGYYYDYLGVDSTISTESKKQLGDDSISSRTANYTPYTLFCFNSKINSKLRSIKDSYNCHLMHKKSGNKIKLYIEIRDGQEFTPITKELKPIIEQMVEESKVNEDHFLLFKPLTNIDYNNVCIPYWWMISVLECISLSDSIQYDTGEIEQTYPYYSDGGLYMKLNNNINYQEVYLRVLFDLYSTLGVLYNKGCIKLTNTSANIIIDANYDDVTMINVNNISINNTNNGINDTNIDDNDMKFISRWDLVKLNPNDKGEYCLYIPKWRNIMFARHASDFLLDMYLKKEIEFNIGHNNITRHLLIKHISDFDDSNRFSIRFSENYLYAKINNIDDADDLCYAIILVLGIDISNIDISYCSTNNSSNNSDNNVDRIEDNDTIDEQCVEYDVSYYGRVKSCISIS